MVKTVATCLGCGVPKSVRDGFCQACEHKIEPARRPIIRDIERREELLELNVRKLTANTRHQVVTIQGLHEHLFALRRFLPAGADLCAAGSIRRWAGSLEGERQPLIGRIARQRAAIDVLRRKHGWPRRRQK